MRRLTMEPLSARIVSHSFVSGIRNTPLISQLPPDTHEASNRTGTQSLASTSRTTLHLNTASSNSSKVKAFPSLPASKSCMSTSGWYPELAARV